MKKLIITLAIIQIHCFYCLAQPCIQPGSLVTVRSITNGKYEYIVFKFLKPHSDKGILSSGTADLFPFAAGKKYSYHKIVFSNVTNTCDNKLDINTDGKKLVGFKIHQKTDNKVSYVFELAEGAKITGHYVKQSHDLSFVKIRIE